MKKIEIRHHYLNTSPEEKREITRQLAEFLLTIKPKSEQKKSVSPAAKEVK